jgi:hypothetical protein
MPGIPRELRARAQWVAWRSVERDGESKHAKVPVDPKTGRNASPTDPSTWADSETAFAFAAERELGVGFVLTHDDPFCCIDLDATDDPAVQAIHRQILESANGAYIETSPSGKGWHLWVKHAAPITSPRAVPGVECYSHDRFITVTGVNARGQIGEMPPGLGECLAPCFAQKTELVVPQGPLDASDHEVLTKVRERCGDRFDALWRGEWQGEYPTQSEADFDLVFWLARFSGDDAQVARLFLESGLGQRDKARRPDYLATTIHNARQAVARDLAAIEHGRQVAESILRNWFAAIRSKVAGLLVRWEDFVAAMDPPSRLVKGLLSVGGVSVLYGESGVGKSFVALDIGAAVAAGAPWMGRATEKGKVLYAVGEGVKGFRRRCKALMKDRGFDKPPFAILPDSLNIPDEVETFLLVVDLFAKTYGGPPDLLVLDTLARYFGEGEENSARDMGRFLRAIDQLRRTYPDTHVLIVHHAGKDPARGMRGSSALKGAADTVLVCSKVMTKGELSYVVEVEKQKDGEEGLRFPFRLRKVDLDPNEDGEPVTSCVVAPDRTVGAAGPVLTEPQVVAVNVLRDLARTDSLMNSKIQYGAYRERFCQLRGGNDQKVRKAASRAVTDLATKLGAVEWNGGEEPIHLPERFWNLKA